MNDCRELLPHILEFDLFLRGWERKTHLDKYTSLLLVVGRKGEGILNRLEAVEDKIERLEQSVQVEVKENIAGVNQTMNIQRTEVNNHFITITADMTGLKSELMRVVSLLERLARGGGGGAADLVQMAPEVRSVRPLTPAQKLDLEVMKMLSG